VGCDPRRTEYLRSDGHRSPHLERPQARGIPPPLLCLASRRWRDRRAWDPGVYAGAAPSCEFARQVRRKMSSDPGASVEIAVHSHPDEKRNTPMTISGRTKLIAHLGYPTESFKAPMIYNPYFERCEVDAVVVPMGCKAEDYPAFLKLVFKLSNIHGALVTMPHKVTTVPLLDEVLTTAKVAGACNAIRLGPGGTLVGDMFDGEGFVRGILRKGRVLAGARVLVVGSGGVVSAIVASLAKAGVAELALFDAYPATMNGLAERLRTYYPALKIEVGSK